MTSDHCGNTDAHVVTPARDDYAAYYERAAWPRGEIVQDPNDPSRRGTLVRRCARLWVDRDHRPPLVRWHGTTNAVPVPWYELCHPDRRARMTPDHCGNTEPHGSHRYDLDQDSRGYVWSWLNCPGTGTGEPKPAGIDAETTADMIRAERDLWVRHCSSGNPELTTVMEALDSLTARLAIFVPTELQVEFFKRCGHTGI